MIHKVERQPITPWIFAESMYMLEGKPFRLTTGRNYFKPIYNADMDSVLLMTGRQVEKTTTESTKIANNVLLKKFSRSLYVAPLNEQVKTFSRGRLDKLFRYSQNDLVRKRYMDSDLTNQVFHKEFNNGSEIYLRNCYEEADNIRGLSVDDIFIDEIQDILVEALPVIMETQTRSKNPHLFYTGTPKSLSNTIQQQWDKSSQGEWVIQCPRCRTHQILGIPNVTPKGFICRAPRCGKPLPDIARAMGRWEHAYPERRMKGFRITQMMVPDIDPAKIYEKIMNYPKDKLYNEVLGRSFEKADKPFTQAFLNSITHDHIAAYARPVDQFALRPIFMGIDWGEGEKSGKAGTGYTVMVIYSYNEDGKFQMLHSKRFERGDDLDPDVQLRYAEMLMKTYKVNICVADYGAGQKENMRLRKLFKERFFQCHYVGRQKMKQVYEEVDFKYKLPRSYWLTQYIEFVQAEGIVLPGQDNEENIAWLHANFLSLFSEYRHTTSGISEELFYSHSASEPDDGFHASFYAWFASKLYKPTSNSAPGRRTGSIFSGAHGA
jgi:hypothetical protein